MKTLLIFGTFLFSLYAHSDYEDRILNTTDQNRPSLAFLVDAYQDCVRDLRFRGSTRGQAVTQCNCWGEYSWSHTKMNETPKEAEKIAKDSEKFCNQYLSRLTIVEGNNGR